MKIVPVVTIFGIASCRRDKLHSFGSKRFVLTQHEVIESKNFLPYWKFINDQIKQKLINGWLTSFHCSPFRCIIMTNMTTAFSGSIGLTGLSTEEEIIRTGTDRISANTLITKSPTSD